MSPIRYLPQDDVIFVDMSGLARSEEGVHQLVDDLVEAASRLDHKTYLLASWEGWEPRPELFEVYGRRAGELLKHFKGIVRYGLRDVRSRVSVRGLFVRQNDLRGAAIFETREQALDAIERMRAEEAAAGGAEPTAG